MKFYYSCVYSTIFYCLVTWGGVAMCTRRCDRVTKLHNRIVSNLFSKYFNDNNDVFKSVKLLKFPDIYKLRVSIYMFKIVKMNSIPSLERSLCISYPSHSYETRSRNRLDTPFPRVESIRMNYKYQFCNVWNEVPEDIKTASSVRSFKKLLTNFYLSSY